MKIETVSSIERIKDFCKKSFKDICPFINYDFFSLLEKSKCTTEQKGWKPEHIVIREGNNVKAFIPNFRKFTRFRW